MCFHSPCFTNFLVLEKSLFRWCIKGVLNYCPNFWISLCNFKHILHPLLNLSLNATDFFVHYMQLGIIRDFSFLVIIWLFVSRLVWYYSVLLSQKMNLLKHLCCLLNLIFYNFVSRAYNVSNSTFFSFICLNIIYRFSYYSRSKFYFCLRRKWWLIIR